ncbi:hypothetical protein CPT_Mansal_091 [Salmonella phage Mansal]|nr:hypothetical protein CPT_Mansal_095 [Salmonella phage Mansal]
MVDNLWEGWRMPLSVLLSRKLIGRLTLSGKVGRGAGVMLTAGWLIIWGSRSAIAISACSISSCAVK